VVTLEHVREAVGRLATVARRTPLEPSAALGAAIGGPVWLKLECLQETGSFKVRGAANLLLDLDPETRTRGVVTVSTGNHGRAVSFVARSLGVPALVCLSRRVPEHKVAAVRALVDEVALVDEAAIAEAMAFVFTQHGLVLEGAGAVAVAALRSGAARPRGPTAADHAPGGARAPWRGRRQGRVPRGRR
jgi:threonine dehydratase